MSELKLPELGENIEQADVAAVLVSEGEVIRKDQPVIEVETEKASLEVPAESSGRVVELRVRQGDTIKVGQVILVVEPARDSAGATEKRSAEAAEPEGAEDGEQADAVERERPARSTRRASARKTSASTKRRRRAEPEAAPEDEPEGEEKEIAGAPEKAEHEPEQDRAVLAFPAREGQEDEPDLGDPVPAAPSVRALARELGVDVSEVSGSGPGGRITREDVKAHTRSLIRELRESPRPRGIGRGAIGLPDFSQWGEVTREPLSRIRRVTAEAMAHAWTTVPHVAQHDQADVTELERTRRRYNARAGEERPRLTVTAIAIKAAAVALRRFPQFNASLDVDEDEVVYKRYVHVGVAVDTDRGLLVPVIRDADRRGIAEIAAELDDLADRGRQRKLKPEEMRGASFTVTNLGGLGTTSFAPIVHWPEVAILGIGRAETRPVWTEAVPGSSDAGFEPRTVLPLSVSYDHRLIDGADAARFLRFIAEGLEQPLLLLVEESGR